MNGSTKCPWMYIEGQKPLNILPIQLTDKKKKHVNLVQDSQNDNVSYFAWIKSLSRLATEQKRYVIINKSKVFVLKIKNNLFCRCLHYFSQTLEAHSVETVERWTTAPSDYQATKGWVLATGGNEFYHLRWFGMHPEEVSDSDLG